MKPALYVAATAVALLSVVAVAKTPSTPPAKAAIATAIADTHRPEKDTQQDAIRHPADLVAFSKVKPGDVVVDVWPGGGYWTRLFSPIVGAKGKVYAYVPSEIAGFK